MNEKTKTFVATFVGTFLGTIAGCYAFVPAITFIIENRETLRWPLKKRTRS